VPDVGRVAGIGRSSRCSQSQSTVGRDARLSIGIAVCRVAGIPSAGRSRSDQRECAIGRDTLDALRIGVGRVAGVLSGRGLTSQRTGECTSGGRGQREEKCAVHVAMRSSRVEEDVGVLRSK
jgi:hypothetical protein